MDSNTRKYSLGNPGPADTIRVPVILARLVLVLGWIFSLLVMGSCRFVYATIDNSVADLSVPLPETLESYLPANSRRGLGFSSWELDNGECSRPTLGDELTATLRDPYADFLGRDW
jgi:hypothetical protein